MGRLVDVFEHGFERGVEMAKERCPICGAVLKGGRCLNSGDDWHISWEILDYKIISLEYLIEKRGEVDEKNSKIDTLS